MTTHREENVDFIDNLKGIILGVSEASNISGLPVAFLAHPRTIKRLKEFELWHWVNSLSKINVHEAVGNTLRKVHGRARCIAHARAFRENPVDCHYYYSGLSVAG